MEKDTAPTDEFEMKNNKSMALQDKTKHQFTSVCIRLKTKNVLCFLIFIFLFFSHVRLERHEIFFVLMVQRFSVLFFNKCRLPAKISELLLALIAAKRGWDWSRWKDDHRDPHTNMGMGFCGSGCHLDQQNPDRLSWGLESSLPERTREITSFRS